MSPGRWLTVRVLACGIRKANGHQLALIREAFDKRFGRHDEQWRRDVWREAAEKAAR